MNSLEKTENVGTLLSFTAQIVSAHVSNNHVDSNNLPELIQKVYSALSAVELSGGDAACKRPDPAVPIHKSIKPEYIICLEDGKKLKMLKRHLKTAYNMTPEEYKDRWGWVSITLWWLLTMQSSAVSWLRRLA